MSANHVTDTVRIRPPLGGSLVYLVLNFLLGIVGFVVLLTLTITGISTAIIWAGIPITALAILVARGGAQMERARTSALLDVTIPEPGDTMPAGTWKTRWSHRLRDSLTWRSYLYFFLLFPLGIAHFVLVVTLWSVSLGLIGLPIYYRFLPGGAWHFPGYQPEGMRWITVDSVPSALPWTIAGVALLALVVVITRFLAGTHARFARFLLSSRRDRQPEPIRNPGQSVSAPTDQVIDESNGTGPTG